MVKLRWDLRRCEEANARLKVDLADLTDVVLGMANEAELQRAAAQIARTDLMKRPPQCRKRAK